MKIDMSKSKQEPLLFFELLGWLCDKLLKSPFAARLKVHKRDYFFGSDFEFFPIFAFFF
jgi:hypothetical protein